MKEQYKGNNNPWIIQRVSKKTRDSVMKTAFDAIDVGIGESRTEFMKRPNQYDFSAIKPNWIISAIKRNFIERMVLSELTDKVRHIKSSGSNYFLVEDRLLLCFKKMNRKGRINGQSTKRFTALMEGGLVQYPKAMLDVLAKMGIRKPIPIVFAGYITDKVGELEDVRMVCYNHGEVAYMESLLHKFRPSLFSIPDTEQQNGGVVRSKKNQRNNNQTGNNSNIAI